MFPSKTSSMTLFAVFFHSQSLINSILNGFCYRLLALVLHLCGQFKLKKQQKRSKSTKPCDCFFKFVFKFYLLSQFQSVRKIYFTKHLSQENANKSNHFTFNLRMWPYVATF